MIKICVYQPELAFPPTFAGQILAAVGVEMSYFHGHIAFDYNDQMYKLFSSNDLISIFWGIKILKLINKMTSSVQKLCGIANKLLHRSHKVKNLAS